MLARVGGCGHPAVRTFGGHRNQRQLTEDRDDHAEAGDGTQRSPSSARPDQRRADQTDDAEGHERLGDREPGLTPERARDVFMLLSGPQIYAQLARDLKWSRTEIEQWTTAAILQQLFGLP